MQHSKADPFGTAELRRMVLAAWTASPARFREDANAEGDYVLGGAKTCLTVPLDRAAREQARPPGDLKPGRSLAAVAKCNPDRGGIVDLGACPLEWSVPH